MIEVSNAWKEAHKQTLLPETFVEITLDVVDTPTAATVSGKSEAVFSNSPAIVNNTNAGTGAKHAVLEHNLWALDGSLTIGDGLATGYVSADDTLGGVEISLSRTGENTIPGFTITWSSEHGTYATNFTLEVKSAGITVATTTVADNASNVSVIDLPISNYDYVTITVHGWSHPDQRTRIDSVKLGHSIVFDKDEIISYSHEQSGSPLGTELSKNAIEFEVDNSDGRWNILNPTGLSKYLYERQKLVVRYGQQTNIGVEWIQAGVFYLTEWIAPSNGITATFVARDAIEFMLNASYSRPYLLGVTTGEIKAYAVKEEVIDQHGNPGTGVVLATLPAGIGVKVYEQSYQYSEGSEDAGWLLYRIEQGWVYPFYITIISDVLLSTDAHNALAACLPGGIQIFDYSADNSAPTAIQESTVAELVQQYAAAGRCTMWQDYNGNIHLDSPRVVQPTYVISSDMSYSHPEVELAKPLKEVAVVGGNRWVTPFVEKTNVFTVNATGESIIVDNPYAWHNDFNRMLADKYIAWWEHREIVSGEFRADPRLELFDCVKVETKYGVLSPVMLTYLKYTYNGAFRAMYEGKVVDESFN